MMRLAFEHPSGVIRLGVVCERCADLLCRAPDNWRSWRRPVVDVACSICGEEDVADQTS